MTAASHLLTTKFFVPQAGGALVSRARLLERLDAGAAGKLTLLSAPAGFGKTTLLAEWVARTALPVAWVSLDAGDNDAVRFLRHLVTALQLVQPGLGAAAQALLTAPQVPPLEAVLTMLLNELAEELPPATLILDDYHLIEAPPVHALLTFGLEHLPPTLRLIIASRSDPPLPLARLRASAQLGELRAEDLRFTLEEAANFLGQAMALSLSAAAVRALAERTEGWVVGLHLAALTLRRHPDPEAFVATFAGDNRYIVDYLMDEAFSRQAEGVQSFLLHTAILDSLSAPLCQAVLGEGEVVNAQARLEGLEQANLFIIPLDDKRQWYRYHHLFAEMLQHRLRSTRAQLLPTLHRRAADWYEAHGFVEPALNHLLAIGDYARAGELVAQSGPQHLWRRGEVSTVTYWLDRFPFTQLAAQPQLGLLSAWTHYVSGRMDALEEVLGLVETRLNGAAPTPADASDHRQLRGEVAALRAFKARVRGDLSRALERSRAALAEIGEADLRARGLATANLAETYYLSGNVSAAEPACETASRLLLEDGNVFPGFFMRRRLAEVQTHKGHLRRAADTCEHMQALIAQGDPRHHPAAGLVEIVRGDLLREHNQLVEAAAQLKTGIERGKRVANPRIFLFGYVALARTLQAQGDMSGALECLHEAGEAERQHHVTWTWGLPSVGAQLARLHLKRGELSAATAWVQASGLSAQDELSFPREAEHLSLARVLSAQREPAEALALLGRLRQAAEQGGRYGRVLEILVLQALTLQAQGDGEGASAALEQALTQAEPESYLRLFVDEGAPMRKLLDGLRVKTSVPAYVDHLLAALGDASPPGADAAPLPEPLSERERTVLRLLSMRLSDKEIAKELGLAVNTVKWYDRNIYSKLGVRTRREATSKAKALDLL